jgi:hypothetical protein
MSDQKNQIKVMTYDYLTLSLFVNYLLVVRTQYDKELMRHVEEYPDLIDSYYDLNAIAMTDCYHIGLSDDKLGCVWSNAKHYSE